MRNFFLQLKDKLTQPVEEETSEEPFEEYVELDHGKEEKSRVIVHPFIMEEFEDIKPILDSLREGSTIALINIRPLKDKDIVELHI